MTSKFEVGSEVIVPSQYTAEFEIVDKVYKNGNFTLVGSNQQWKPNYDGKTATMTGRTGWRTRSIWLATPEAMARFVAERDQEVIDREVRSVMSRINSFKMAGMSLEILEAMRTLEAQISIHKSK